ncbi:MAG: c-type cytochrome [Saprospiraceae bacterium]|nr:c-type cytochrome [Saprospiraceae bacterium]
MKKFNVIIASILFSGMFFLASCGENEPNVTITYYGEKEYKELSKHINIPEYPYNYSFSLPKHTFLTSTPMNDDLATLGRVLFYDKNLSKDKTISCASCHKQEIAFSDDVAFSEGVQNRATARNSIALGSVLNFAAYYGNFGGVPFFWDNRATSVQDQSKATLGNPLEMDMKMHEVANAVNGLDYYKPLIKQAYKGSDEISETQILNAIGEFVNSITNYNTKFDRELDNQWQMYGSLNNNVTRDFPGFSASENNGKKLYLQHCSNCHGSNSARPPVMKANNGLMLQYNDLGVASTTGYSFDESMFKVPTLRNISRTAPYMHNGMLKTLKDVIDHYSEGIKNHKNLSSDLKIGSSPKKMNFSETEKEDLLAFLQTLNDDKIVSDPKFSDPFQK